MSFDSVIQTAKEGTAVRSHASDKLEVACYLLKLK